MTIFYNLLLLDDTVYIRETHQSGISDFSKSSERKTLATDNRYCHQIQEILCTWISKLTEFVEGPTSSTKSSTCIILYSICIVAIEVVLHKKATQPS
jgi:hypothetical protein